jgi:dUTP pyrophosphatase
MQTVRVKKLHPDAILPTYGSAYAAGADLYALPGEDISIAPGETAWVRTGLAMEIPMGYVALIFARSGLACKQGLAPANKVGVVDADYRGEFMIVLHNHSDAPAVVHGGDRIAQMVITPYLTAAFEETDELSDTARGAGGFGSTGA